MNRRKPTRKLVLLLLLAPCTIFSQNMGVPSKALSFKKNVSVVKTKWFDIIYPQESSATAALLAENADAIYEKVARELDTAPLFRLPLVISRTGDYLNAYYSPFPYNHIVMYDTLPGSDMAVYSDSLLSVLEHELVHAVSLTFKSPFIRALSTVIGDGFSPALINMPPSFYEGAAVALESAGGEGRLNSDYSLHIVRQAKIEGKFPAWDDATGFRDIAPGGSLPYILGGAFSAWLLEQYGKEKFAEFWKQGGRFQFFKVSPGIFKKVYGVPLRTAWKQFADSVKVPQIPANPEDTPGIAGESESPVSFVSKKNQRYSSLTSSLTGTAWLDTATGSVWFLPLRSSSSSEQVKPQKLLTLQGLQTIRFSLDGRYLALTWRTRNAYPKNRVSVYDTVTKKRAEIDAPSLRDAAVVRLADGRDYLCAVEVLSQKAALVYYPLETLKTGNEAYRFDLPPGTIPFAPLDAGKGYTAFVCKEKPGWSIALFSPETGGAYFFDAPSPDIELRDLNVKTDGNTTRLYFSWAGNGNLPRAGYLELNPAAVSAADETASSLPAAWHLLDTDISGGIYSPAPFASASDGETVLYAAQFFDYDALLSLDMSRLPVTTIAAVPRYEPSIAEQKTATAKDTKSTKEIPETKDALEGAKKYYPISYWKRGTFIPFPLVSVYDETLQPKQALVLGTTYITTDPGEQVLAIGSGAYDPVENRGGASVNFIGGADIFSFDTAANAIFSADGLNQLFAQNTFSSLVKATGAVRITLSDTTAFYMEENTLVQNTARLQFSTIKRYGTGYWETGGVTLAPFYQFLYAESLDAPRHDVGMQLGLSFPWLLPFQNPRLFTLNLPFDISAVLCPSYYEFAQLTASAVLFSVEIQKGIPYATLFVRRFSIIPAYKRSYRRDETVTDTVTLSAATVLGINTGALANVGFEIDCNFTWHIGENQSAAPKFTLGGRIRY